jgi:uncharacterized membrane protein
MPTSPPARWFGRVIQPVRRRLSVYTLALILAFTAYSAYWSCITILKFYALNASVFDLGAFMQSMWSVYGAPWTPYQFLSTLFERGFQFVIFPLSVPKSYELILTVQSIAIAGVVFPLFGAAHRILKNDLVATMVCLCYLLYFPLAGLNWFDAHYEAFFPLLFMTGYYFYVVGRYRLASGFVVLSGTVAFLYMVLPFIFAFTVGIEALYRGKHIRALFSDSKGRFIAWTASISMIVLIVGLLLGGLTSNAAVGGYLHAGSGGPFLNVNAKVITIILIFAPLLFIPVFSFRGLLLALPFCLLVFLVNYGPYEFPHAFMYQYLALALPGLFIGLIEGLSWLEGRIAEARTTSESQTSALKRFRRRLAERRIAVPGAVLCAVILLALVYQPYGPFNSYSSDSFNVAAETDVNYTLLTDLHHVLSLVPSDASGVLVQDNLPQAFPGALGNMGMVPGLVGPDITSQDVAQNKFPYTGLPGNLTTPLDYAIADATHESMFNNPISTGYPSMYTILQDLMLSGYYEIEAEAGGIILVTRNYTGPVQVYSPYDKRLIATDMTAQAPIEPDGGNLCLTNDVDSGGGLIWDGPFISLPPGSYVARYDLYTDSSSAVNSLRVDVSGNSGQVVVNSTNVTGPQLANGSWQTVNLDFTLTNFLSNVEFRGFVENWQGTLCLGSVDMTQIGPVQT